MLTHIEISMWNVVKFVLVSFILSPVLELAANYANAAYYGLKIRRKPGLRLRSTRLGLAGMHHEIDLNSSWWRLKTLFVVVLAALLYLPLEYGSGAEEVMKEGVVSVNLDFKMPEAGPELVNIFQPGNDLEACLNITGEIRRLEYAVLENKTQHKIELNVSATVSVYGGSRSLTLNDNNFICVPQEAVHGIDGGLQVIRFKCEGDDSEDTVSLYQTSGIPVAMLSKDVGLCDIETNSCYNAWETAGADLVASLTLASVQLHRRENSSRIHQQVIVGLGNMVKLSHIEYTNLSVSDVGSRSSDGRQSNIVVLELTKMELRIDENIFGNHVCGSQGSLRVPPVRSNLQYNRSVDAARRFEFGFSPDDVSGVIRTQEALIPFRYGRREKEFQGYAGEASIETGTEPNEIIVSSRNLLLIREVFFYSCREVCTIDEFGRLVLALAQSESASRSGRPLSPKQITGEDGTDVNDIVVVSKTSREISTNVKTMQQGTVEVWAILYYFSLLAAALTMWIAFWIHERKGGLCISVERVYRQSIMERATDYNCPVVPRGPPTVSVVKGRTDDEYHVTASYDEFNG